MRGVWPILFFTETSAPADREGGGGQRQPHGVYFLPAVPKRKAMSIVRRQ